VERVVLRGSAISGDRAGRGGEISSTGHAWHEVGQREPSSCAHETRPRGGHHPHGGKAVRKPRAEHQNSQKGAHQVSHHGRPGGNATARGTRCTRPAKRLGVILTGGQAAHLRSGPPSSGRTWEAEDSNARRDHSRQERKNRLKETTRRADTSRLSSPRSRPATPHREPRLAHSKWGWV
jgi:hypothetical protein